MCLGMQACFTTWLLSGTFIVNMLYLTADLKEMQYKASVIRLGYLCVFHNEKLFFYSMYSSLLTDTSYAVRFSVSFSPIRFIYSRLWILPQIRTCPPTSKAEAYLAFLPQQMQGM